SFSSRFLTSVSTRTVKVVEAIAIKLVIDCVHTSTSVRHGKNLADKPEMALTSGTQNPTRDVSTLKSVRTEILGLRSFEILQHFARLTDQGLKCRLRPRSRPPVQCRMARGAKQPRYQLTPSLV